MARPKKENKEEIKKQELYQQQWVDTYFNCNFNGRITSKFLKPHLSLDACEVDAARMLGNDRVKELIAIKQEQVRIKQDVSLEFIVNGLKRIIMDVMEEMVERDDQGRITSKPDRKSALAAYQQLTKIAGFDAPKKIDVKLSGNIDISKLVSFDEDDDEKQQLND